MNLSELVQHVLDEEELYYSDLIRRAESAGYETSKAALSKIVNREVKNFPKPETIFMLSHALNRSPGVIVNAACQSFGIVIYPADVENDSAVFSEHPLSRDELALRRGDAREVVAVTTVITDSATDLTGIPDAEASEDVDPDAQPRHEGQPSS